MTKIRINELARQLEVPSHAIIEMLPELGVSEKKTHSSSIDESVEKIIRERLSGGGGDAARREAANSVAVAEPEAGEEAAHPEPTSERPSTGARSAGSGVSIEPHAPPLDSTSASPTTTAQEATVTIVEEPLRSKPAPLRPPLAAGGVAPLHPPLRTGPIPARPGPAPRPGQILSGPRQPIPPATPAAPMPPASITLPAHPVARSASRNAQRFGSSCCRISAAVDANAGNALASAAASESGRPTRRAAGGSAPSRYGGAVAADPSSARSSTTATPARIASP